MGLRKFFSKKNGADIATTASTAPPVAGKLSAPLGTRAGERQSTTNRGEGAATTKHSHRETPRDSHSALQPRESCWAKATKTLQNTRPNEYKKLEQIKFRDESQGLDDPANLLKWAELKMDRGQNVLRTFESTLRYILQFKDVVLAAANFDPYKAAPAVCRVFYVALESYLGEYALSREVLRDLNTVASNLSHWANVENLYLGTTKNDSNKFNPLESKLVKLYTGILNLGTVLGSWVSADRTVKRLKQAQATVNWQNLIKDINADHKACESTLGECKLKIDECGKIKAWISDYHPEEAHNNALKRTGVSQKYRTCGQWFLDTSQFKTWSSVGHTPDQKIIWLRGTTGTGKSTLLARIVQWHLDRASIYPDRRFAYFYCSRGKDFKTHHSYESVLRALLRQAAYDPVKGEVVASVLNAYQNAGGSSGDLQPLTLEGCEKLLRGILEPKAKFRLRIMVDALDECDQPKELLKALRAASQDNPGALELLVSSRREVQVNEKLPNAVMINLSTAVSMPDMVRYITTEVLEREMDERLLKGKFAHLEQRLVEILCDRAGGMFRWVELQLSVFLNSRTPYRLAKSVEQALERLDTGSLADEKDLWAAYSDIFDRNADRESLERVCASTIYKLMRCAQVKLTTRFITKAVAFSMTDQSIDGTVIHQLTQDFLVETEEGVLEFAHASVEEYLLQEYPSEYADKKCAVKVAQICIKKITSHDMATFEAALSVDELLFYSFRYWGKHCAGSNLEDRRSLGISSDLIDWIVKGSGSTKFRYFFSLGSILTLTFPRAEAAVDSDSPIFVACRHNLVEVLEKLLSVDGAFDLHLNLRNNMEQTPLSFAVQSGSEDIVQMLLRVKKVDINLQDKYGQTALSYAAAYGVESIMKLLLASSADVDRPDKHGRTPLSRTTQDGHAAAAKLLIAWGADVSLQDDEGRTALSWAALYGHEATIELLLQRGANVNLQDKGGRTPLSYAARSGHEAATKLLLQWGANANLPDMGGRTPLQHAQDPHWQGPSHQAVIELLQRAQGD